MTKKQVVELIELLKEYYPDAKCSLDFNTSFELLIAVMLSAQCTDERVNKVTHSMFLKYNTATDFVNLNIAVIENLIHSCGFYKTKAKNIKNLSIMIQNEFNGNVPNTIPELVKLPRNWKKMRKCYYARSF